MMEEEGDDIGTQEDVDRMMETEMLKMEEEEEGVHGDVLGQDEIDALLSATDGTMAVVETLEASMMIGDSIQIRG